MITIDVDIAKTNGVSSIKNTKSTNVVIENINAVFKATYSSNLAAWFLLLVASLGGMFFIWYSKKNSKFN